MSRTFEGWIDHLCKKSGYNYDFLVDRYNGMVDDPDWDGDMEQFIGITLERDW